VQRIDETTLTDPPSAATADTFEAFFTREYRRVVGFAYALTGSWQAAEDVAQDAFIAAHGRWDEIRAYDVPAAWVRRVACNRAVSLGRRSRSEHRALDVLRRRRPVHATLDAADHEFWAEVRKLSPNQSTAITLHYLEDLPVERIAEVLECAPATARVHLHRGRKALALALDLEDSP